jgi:hypothetical protein
MPLLKEFIPHTWLKSHCKLYVPSLPAYWRQMEILPYECLHIQRNPNLVSSYLVYISQVPAEAQYEAMHDFPVFSELWFIKLPAFSIKSF